ncbi:MAG: hypothetical protein KatS3mg123_0710 [Burkholderiales bacterium]|nr:MAG: hypothetical protein KatS3mg123_0710 [Burkholderiales bacterium]
MAVHNADIAAMFEEIADLLEIQGANPFRVRAYRNAARTVEGLGRDLAALVKAGEDLTELPGIGEDLAAKIREAVETGRLAFLDRLHKELPPAITELLKIPGLGPKRVKALYHDLGVQTLEQLARAARDGRIRELPGFGAKTEEKILEAVEAHLSSARRFKLAVAAQYAAPLVEHLRKAPGVGRVVVAGSFRRMRETVGDLDILVTTTHPEEAVRRFAGYEEVKEVLSKGGTRASVVLRCGLQVDLRVVAEESYGAALHYFTGSKAHNIAIRRLAQERGLKVNEYGVYRGEERIAGRTEEEVYATVDLPYIPPELREDQGEIEAARAGRLPQLVELADLKGDLHAHTKATDGKNTLEEMAEAARKLGFEYLAITEHSRRLTVARGLDPRRLEQQIDEIERSERPAEGHPPPQGRSRWTSWRTAAWTCRIRFSPAWTWWWGRCTASSIFPGRARPSASSRPWSTRTSPSSPIPPGG